MKYDQIWNPEIILHNNQGIFNNQRFADFIRVSHFLAAYHNLFWINYYKDGNYYPESFSDFQLTVYSNGTIIYSPAGIFVSFVLTFTDHAI